MAEQCSFKPQLAASLKSYNWSGGPHSPRKGGTNSMPKPPGYLQVLPHYNYLTASTSLQLPHDTLTTMTSPP